jgi:hypothetical protein
MTRVDNLIIIRPMANNVEDLGHLGITITIRMTNCTKSLTIK